MKLLLLILIFTISGSVFASAEVSLTCQLKEKNTYTEANKKVLPLTTFSETGLNSLVIKPRLALDNSALYVLSLSLGEDYTDADGEVVGSDYYLSLVRMSTPGSARSMTKIQGRTESILKIESFEGRKASFSSRKKTNNLSLEYNIGQKKIHLNCQILSLR